jgi:hypothetical protein
VGLGRRGHEVAGTKFSENVSSMLALPKTESESSRFVRVTFISKHMTHYEFPHISRCITELHWEYAQVLQQLKISLNRH